LSGATPRQGTYGKVLRVRKIDGGAEYAVKIFTGSTLGDPLTFEVLLELKALFKARSARRRASRCCSAPLKAEG